MKRKIKGESGMLSGDSEDANENNAEFIPMI